MFGTFPRSDAFYGTLNIRGNLIRTIESIHVVTLPRVQEWNYTSEGFCSASYMGYPWELRLRYFTHISLRPGFAVPDEFGRFRVTYSVASWVVLQGKKCHIRCKNQGIFMINKRKRKCSKISQKIQFLSQEALVWTKQKRII